MARFFLEKNGHEICATEEAEHADIMEQIVQDHINAETIAEPGARIPFGYDGINKVSARV